MVRYGARDDPASLRGGVVSGENTTRKDGAVVGIR